LVLFFTWQVFLGSSDSIFGYSQQGIFTYILLAVFMKGFILSTRGKKIAAEIASGGLNQFLVKPISFLRYSFIRDFAGKFQGLVTNLLIIAFVAVILNINFVWPKNGFYILTFLVQMILAALIYFVLSSIVSYTTFWYFEHNGWPARFLFEVVTDFMSGVVFPLTIFGPVVGKFMMTLPFAFLIYHPLQIYLGEVSQEVCLLIIGGSLIWLIALYKLSSLLWKKGLIRYEAFGG
jgi:ABC-2 type transport system permease protein